MAWWPQTATAPLLAGTPAPSPMPTPLSTLAGIGNAHAEVDEIDSYTRYRNQLLAAAAATDDLDEDNGTVRLGPGSTVARHAAAERTRAWLSVWLVRAGGAEIAGQTAVEAASVDTPIGEGNVGYQLLRQMGWVAGTGLGRRGSGARSRAKPDAPASPQALTSAFLRPRRRFTRCRCANRTAGPHPVCVEERHARRRQSRAGH